MPFVCEAALILPCRTEPVGNCDYCGRRFCARHGRLIQTTFPFRKGETIGVCARHVRLYHREDRVWSGWLARQKRLDEALAQVREVARGRNREGLCGYPGCNNPGKYVCDAGLGSCGLRFCHLHIRDANERICTSCEQYRGRTRHMVDEASRLVAEIREPLERP